MKKNTMEDQDGMGLTPDLLIPLKREADKCKQDEMTFDPAEYSLEDKHLNRSAQAGSNNR